MQINCTKRTFVSIYDFNIYGGTENIPIQLGVYFKPYSKIQNWYILTMSDFLADGDALISIGLTGISNNCLFVNPYSNLNGTAVFVETTYINNVPSSGSQLILTINDYPITAGKAMICIDCIEMDI